MLRSLFYASRSYTPLEILPHTWSWAIPPQDFINCFWACTVFGLLIYLAFNNRDISQL